MGCASWTRAAAPLTRLDAAVGEVSRIRDHHNELKVSVAETGPPDRNSQWPSARSTTAWPSAMSPGASEPRRRRPSAHCVIANARTPRPTAASTSCQRCCGSSPRCAAHRAMGARPELETQLRPVSAADARRAAPGNTACLRGSRLSRRYGRRGRRPAAGPGRRRRPRQQRQDRGEAFCHADLQRRVKGLYCDKRGPMIWYPARVLLPVGIVAGLILGCAHGRATRSVTWQRAPPSSPACDGRGYRPAAYRPAEQLIAGRVAGVRVTRAPRAASQYRSRPIILLAEQRPLFVVDGVRSRRVRTGH